MPLRLQDLEEAPFRVRIQGLHKAKTLAGRNILLVVSSEGEDVLADNDFEMLLFLLPVADIATINPDRKGPSGMGRVSQSARQPSTKAHCSSPHDGLSRAMQRMSACRSAGMGGRPGVDCHRQNSRNPWRCQRLSVAGCTAAKAWRQSNQRQSQTRAIRVAWVARRGLMFRS